MKCSWKQLDSGVIEARVIAYESERYFLGEEEFWRRVTMELPVGLYIVVTKTVNPVVDQFTLKLTASSGQPETVLL